MADENTPPPSDSEDASKADTIRITLPGKADQPIQKRETVRINLPGRPAGITPAPMSAPTAPKKETTKIVTDAAGSTPPPPSPPASAKPFVPPPVGTRPAGMSPPKPPSLSGAAAPPKPPSLSGANPPPKPPSLSARPTIPLKPAPSAPGAPSAPTAPSAPAPKAPEPMTQKAAQPKKETARITLPPDSGKAAALPKATVKMGQTQPLARAPSAMAPAVFQPAAALAPAEPEGPDTGTTIMSIAALVFSFAALGTAYWVYSQSGL